MCDAVPINRLFTSVLHEDMLRYRLHEQDVIVGIKNMKEVYKPNPSGNQDDFLNVANYKDPGHRVAYLHKYAPFHTALVAEMLKRAVAANPNFYLNLITSSETFNMCCLGGGPGNDVIGVLSVLGDHFGLFRSQATIVDCMLEWKDTFNGLVQELRYGGYGDLGDRLSSQYFSWNYVEANLLGPMSEQVHYALTTANLVTMIKFVSAASCKDTPAMIKKIFRTMKPGAAVLYIDNAGGGFHQIIHSAAQECNMFPVFGPLKHQHYQDNRFNIKRFHYTPCLETTVSVQILLKLRPDEVPVLQGYTVPASCTINTIARPHNRGRSMSPQRRSRSKNRNQRRNQSASRNRAYRPENVNRQHRRGGAFVQHDSFFDTATDPRMTTSTLILFFNPMLELYFLTPS